MNWTPTLPQRKFRAKAHREHADVNFAAMTPLQVQTLTGNRSVVGWASGECGEEFWDWFVNRDYNHQQLEAAADLAIRKLYEVLDDPLTEATATISAAREVLKYADYTPSQRREVVYKDDQIGKMDLEQLKQFLLDNQDLVLRVISGGKA